MGREFGIFCSHMTKEICHMTRGTCYRLDLVRCFVLGLSGDLIQESSGKFYGRLKLQKVEMKCSKIAESDIISLMWQISHAWNV